MSLELSKEELVLAAVTVANALRRLNTTFGICGGAGVSLLANHYHIPQRQTADIDLVIQPNRQQGVSAETISQKLIEDFPDQFAAVNHYGVGIPAVRVPRGHQEVLVEVEIFDRDAWPNRPQYNLEDPKNSRVKLNFGGEMIEIFSPSWLLREKILTQAQREGSKKERTDIIDIEILVNLVQNGELVLEQDEFVEALEKLVEKRPDLRSELKQAITCLKVFGP